MRSRFFSILLISIVITAVSISTISFRYFQAERARLIDEHIESLASALVSSGLDQVAVDRLEDMERIISKALTDEPSQPVIIVSDIFGHILFQNALGKLISSRIDSRHQWQTLKLREHNVRVLNLRLSATPLRIHVGLLLDRGQVHWDRVSSTALAYMGIMVVLMILIAYLVTLALMQPLRNLAAYLTYVVREGKRHPGQASPKMKRRLDEKDEFRLLVQAADDICHHMENHVASTQQWMAQMAHEIKTPLTVIRNYLEVMKKSGKVDSVESVIKEVDYSSQLVSRFLEWARTEATTARPEDLYAVKVQDMLEEIVGELNSIYEGRIVLKAKVAMTVFCKPDDLRMVVTNLLSNACKFSAPPLPVEVELSGRGFRIVDQGKGIPRDVLERLGQPFNTGNEESSGTGLGLAWVQTICRRFHWKLNIQSSPQGTEISVDFGDQRMVASVDNLPSQTTVSK